MILALLNQIHPGWTKEHRFHPKRKWRFDYCHEDCMIAVETEGAVWVNGRHTRGLGYLKDMEKYNRATLMGWKVFRYGTSKAEIQRMIEEMEELFNTIPLDNQKNHAIL